ncbi:MAG TPA: N-acyl homoserine lactonase family protein [Alphaproteobacteria bacterium]|nr:N-acyl homoserine lactonase family protein [Alphaproteobacteria bacterium]
MSSSDTYEVYAIRYGTMAERKRHDNFIVTDMHDAPMPIDYYVWAIRNDERTIVVDTGFERTEAEKRGRTIIRLPREGLEMIGIDSTRVKDVVVTHMHYDHAGTLDDFPAATFHLQEAEMRYATGKHMCQAPLGHSYSADHVCTMVRRLFEGRVAFHDGAREIAPGISVHLIGGHTMGVQCVRVCTRRGWVVLASDTSHFYENMEKPSPFPIVYSVGDMLQGFETLRGLADSGRHIVPGHDPLVMQRYPSPSDDLKEVVVRLDAEPRE